MALPPTVRVKLSSEGAGSLSITPEGGQDMPARELVEYMLGGTGKDEARIRELLLRGNLGSGASRFRWTGWDVDLEGLRELLATFPDADASRRFSVLHYPLARRDFARSRRAQELVAAGKFLGCVDEGDRRGRPRLRRILIPRAIRPLPSRLHRRRTGPNPRRQRIGPLHDSERPDPYSGVHARRTLRETRGVGDAVARALLPETHLKPLRG